MIEELQRDEAMSLPDQISRIIRSRIESGEYRPGKRLGTIRQFAKDFEVSPVTVIKALDILEEETLIERIPVKGVFVTDRLKQEKKQLNACFAFPEKEMAPLENAKENWGLNYELYRGLFDGSRQYKINLQFIYFEDNPSRALLEKQKAALRKFDFVIIPGDTQLIDLRDASAAERLTFYLASYFDSPPRLPRPSKSTTTGKQRNSRCWTIFWKPAAGVRRRPHGMVRHPSGERIFWIGRQQKAGPGRNYGPSAGILPIHWSRSKSI